MQWELSELNLQTVILLQFLDTPGDEVAPGSNEIGKNLKNQRLGHNTTPFLSKLDSNGVSGLKSKVARRGRGARRWLIGLRGIVRFVAK